MQVVTGVMRFVLVVILCAVASPVGADFQSGHDAYQRGDYATALREWKPLAERGIADAQYNLGLMYYFGRAVPKDDATAVKWYRKAADQGYAGAHFNLGFMYAEGQGVPQDAAEAMKWYRGAVKGYGKAAEQGEASAQNNLGFMYANGLGVAQDYAKAVKWYSKAAEQGDDLAKRRAGELETKLASEQQPATQPPSVVSDLGTFHALVIGNDAYRALPRLRTAVKDARAVAALLESRYGFRVTTLTNATRAETIQALQKMRSRLTERDNLLIYYAGHGKLDRGADRGYWLPTDAVEDSPVNWINNVTITDTLKAIQAKHVMVVADSCYSGTLTRDTRGIEVRPKESDYIEKTHRKKSRTVLASGGLEPVSDSGGSGHSVFAKAFMDALRDNDGVIDGLDVFAYVRKQVRLNADQVPNYANIRMAGHEVGGDFLFARKLEHRSEAKKEKPTVATIRPAPVPHISSPVKPAVGIFPKTYKPGDTFKDCPDCPQMVVVPAGSFDMGDLSGDGQKNQRPVHRVTIPRPFAVGVYEVTQAEWRSVTGSNPSRFKGDRNPVEQVSWDDAKDFLKRLSSKTGEKYRLLSEAEWEYVARAGSRTKYPWGNGIESSKAKYQGSGNGTRPVGSYSANAFGLFDTVGNVFEWTEDCLHFDYIGAPTNGEAWTTGGYCQQRITRGGSWYGHPSHLPSGVRHGYPVSNRDTYGGFRIARSLPRTN